jgi:hypothetical protein
MKKNITLSLDLEQITAFKTNELGVKLSAFTDAQIKKFNRENGLIPDTKKEVSK